MKRLAILVSYSGAGGVERVINLLVAELLRHVLVDLLVIKFKGPHVTDVPAGARVIRLRSKHAATAVGEIADYLRRERPTVLMAAKDRAGRAALRARARAGVPVPVWLQLHTNMSQSLSSGFVLARWLRLRAMRRSYPRADGVIAVSEGVAEDLIKLCGLPPERVHVIRNPAVPRELVVNGDARPDPPWLADRSCPVIMGMGRLTRQKDFTTLLRAFAELQAEQPSRLIIMGEGSERDELLARAKQLGIAERVSFPGFVMQPYAWLVHADLFVLSSRWEGFGNVLAEALALGVPCVSTDCPSGPREILDDGRLGRLVPVGDPAAMAIAMRDTLRDRLSKETLQAGGAAYRADVVTQQYLQVLGLD